MSTNSQTISNQKPVVQIGVKVTIEVNGQPQTWEVAGLGQTDLKQDRLACDAPLIEMIWGKTAGETAVGKVFDRQMTVTIKQIEPAV